MKLSSTFSGIFYMFNFSKDYFQFNLVQIYFNTIACLVVSPSWRDRPAWRLIGPRLSRHEDCHDRPNVLRPAPASLLPLPLTYYCLGYMRKICSISIRKIENNKSYFSKKNRFSGPVHRPAGHENPFTRTGLSSSPLFLKSWYFQWQLAA